MAEIDYIKFVKGKAYLDTDKLDECFYVLGGSCPGTYERFITRTPEGDHVNLAEIEKAFDAAARERDRTDRLLEEAARKYTKMDKYFFEVDVIQRAFRAPRGIFPLRLFHDRYDCKYNHGIDEGDRQGIRLYFPTEKAYLDFLDENLKSNKIPLYPCPNCGKSYNEDLTAAIRYDQEHHRMQPCPQEYPMDVSWMRVGKEKRAQRRGWRRQSGGDDWGGVLNVLFLIVVTFVLCRQIAFGGLGQALMDFSDKYFGYATGFYPIMLTDPKKIGDWEVIGRDMVLSSDPKVAVQGAAWLALSLATAALIVLHTIYNGWEKDNKWLVNLLLTPVSLLKGLLIALFAIPFACFTIPYTVFVSGARAGKKLSMVLFPQLMEGIPLSEVRRDKRKKAANTASGKGGSSHA